MQAKDGCFSLDSMLLREARESPDDLLRDTDSLGPGWIDQLAASIGDCRICYLLFSGEDCFSVRKAALKPAAGR
jgi:hypothetical protein